MAYLLPAYSDIDLGKPCLSAPSHDLKQWYIASKVSSIHLTDNLTRPEYPQPSVTKIILNINYPFFNQVRRGSMSQINMHVEWGNYRLWNGAFLRRINIQWNWPMLSCQHCSSHLIMTQQVVTSVSYDSSSSSLMTTWVQTNKHIMVQSHDKNDNTKC